MGMPDAEAASSLRSGVDLLKETLDNGPSSNGGTHPASAVFVAQRYQRHLGGSAQRVLLVMICYATHAL